MNKPLHFPGRPALRLVALAAHVALVALVTSTFGVGAAESAARHSSLVLLTNSAALPWARVGDGGAKMTTVCASSTPWNELVVSWNLQGGATVIVEASPVRAGDGDHWYRFGRWSLAGERTSAERQSDETGVLATDTLTLKAPATAAKLRVEVRGGAPSDVTLLSLAFADTRAEPAPRPPVREAWGKIVEPPQRSQAVYPEGVTKWCSATSTSMLLGFWAGRLNRPGLDHAVPETAAGVYDKGWGGTGNWPFNTAYIGAQPGLRACVARFDDLADLERWTAGGFPAAASVSYALMLGRPAEEPGDGHLVVVCGFDAAGDVVINDPGVRPERVRRVVPRDAFDRGWRRSARTVYLAWPEGAAPPFPAP